LNFILAQVNIFARIELALLRYNTDLWLLRQRAVNQELGVK